MKFLIDMNIPPEWVHVFREHGFEAVHWSTAGDPRATDAVIMTWAREHGYIVFTHDLDFSALLAATQAIGPSVLQVRAQDISSDTFQRAVFDAIERFRDALNEGAAESRLKCNSRA